MVITNKTKIVAALGVTTVAAAAGGLYYWKFKKRPRDGRFSTGSTGRRDSKSVFFSDKFTDTMSHTSFGEYDNNWRHGSFGRAGKRSSILTKPNTTTGSNKPSLTSSFNRTSKISKPPSLTKPPSFAKSPNLNSTLVSTQDLSGCSCRVTSCDHNKCTCGDWNNLSSRERSLKSAVPVKAPGFGSTRSNRLSCTCSSTLSARKARMQQRYK